MKIYKVVARHKKKELQPSYIRGNEGTQAKKRIYINEADYLKYSPDLISRWLRAYDVEIYLDEGNGFAFIGRGGAIDEQA